MKKIFTSIKIEIIEVVKDVIILSGTFGNPVQGLEENDSFLYDEY